MSLSTRKIDQKKESVITYFFRVMYDWMMAVPNTVVSWARALWTILVNWGNAIARLFSKKAVQEDPKNVASDPALTKPTHTEPVSVVDKDLDNPKGGDCLFYAASLGFVRMVQHEAISKNPRLNRQLFERWHRLDPSISYEQLSRFNIARPDRAEWDVLQQSLRNILASIRISEMQRVKAEAVASGDCQILRQSSVYRHFLEVYRHPEINASYNPFGDKALGVMEQQFNDIRALNLGLDEEYAHIADLFVSICPEGDQLETSLLVQVLRARANSHVWGTDDDLNELTSEQVFDVNVDVQRVSLTTELPLTPELQQAINPPVLPHRHTLGMKNLFSTHWVTVAQESSRDLDLEESTARGLAR